MKNSLRLWPISCLLLPDRATVCNPCNVAQLRNLELTSSDILTEQLDIEFAQFEGIIRRNFLLQAANVREVERYDGEKRSIETTSARAADHIQNLRSELVVAQTNRANRSAYDAIALEIQRKGLKTRKTQKDNIDKLQSELSELEREKTSYNEVWQTRKKQFEEILDRLRHMQAQITSEKEEQERREGMAEEDDDEPSMPSNEGQHGCQPKSCHEVLSEPSNQLVFESMDTA